MSFRNKRSGVTLIELLSVMTLLGLMAAMLAFMFGSMDVSYRNTQSALDVYQNARGTLVRMSREISGAQIDNTFTPALGLSGQANEINFHTTIEPDAFTAVDTSSDIVAVRYALGGAAGKTLTRYLENADTTTFPLLPVAAASGEVLAENITEMNFEYFRSAADFYADVFETEWDSGSGGENALPVLIRIRLAVEDRKGSTEPHVFEYVMHVRNAS